MFQGKNKLINRSMTQTQGTQEKLLMEEMLKVIFFSYLLCWCDSNHRVATRLELMN